MASLDQTVSNGKSADTGHQNIRHSPYQSCSKLLLPWFDIRVFYVRINNVVVDDYTPECLSVNHLPLDADTLLEVNGVKGISCILRRGRVDKRSEEAIFVSTDRFRLTGSVKFEVFDRESLVLSGILEMSNENGFRKWSMDCESAGMSACAGFFKGKQVIDSESMSPVIEVYVAGCFSGTPIILTKTLQLSSHKKHNGNRMLDSIPEYEAAEARGDVSSELDQQTPLYKNYKMGNDEECNNLYWSCKEYMQGEDGELSWFNAGVRVGVGIGLGICLGVGIGVGLLVRTYQTTSRTVRLQLL